MSCVSACTRTRRAGARSDPGEQHPGGARIAGRDADDFDRVRGLSDPVATGDVSNLARPEANVSGFMLYQHSLAGKWLNLPKDLAPRLTRFTSEAPAVVVREQQLRR